MRGGRGRQAFHLLSHIALCFCQCFALLGKKNVAVPRQDEEESCKAMQHMVQIHIFLQLSCWCLSKGLVFFTYFYFFISVKILSLLE